MEYYNPHSKTIQPNLKAEFARRVIRLVKEASEMLRDGRPHGFFPALFSLFSYCMYRDVRSFFKKKL